MPPVPRIHCHGMFPTLQVSDIQAAIAFYTGKLGFDLRFTWGVPVTFAGVGLDNVTIHLAAVSAPRQQAEVNFIVSDADELFQAHRMNDVPISVVIGDREYGLRDYSVEDPDGNRLGFGHYIYTQGPPIQIERVDVPVRLEKRLAALLTDLATHKKMTVSQCLEETLLHSFEQTEDGVASPHAEHTFDVIESLKKKHGIDYDTHASYRFVE